VDAFFDRHFSFAGTLRLHHHTIGWKSFAYRPIFIPHSPDETAILNALDTIFR
jgi:hypothetical protein